MFTTSDKCPIKDMIQKILLIQTKTKQTHEKLQNSPEVKLPNNGSNRGNNRFSNMELR